MLSTTAIRYPVNARAGRAEPKRLVVQVADIQAQGPLLALGGSLCIFAQLLINLIRGAFVNDHQHGGGQPEVFTQIPAQLRGFVLGTQVLRHQGNHVAQVLTSGQGAGDLPDQRGIAAAAVDHDQMLALEGGYGRIADCRWLALGGRGGRGAWCTPDKLSELLEPLNHVVMS